MENQCYSPAARAAEKQRARDQDQADLDAGRASRDDLRRRNDRLNGLDIAGASIRRWKDFR